MYIKSAKITNIRSIEDFEINFEEPAGWHVLIGDNGSGKSTIIRSLALALVGPDEAKALWEENWKSWLTTNMSSGEIELQIETSYIDERPVNANHNSGNTILNILTFTKDSSKDSVSLKGYRDEKDVLKNSFENNWGDCNGWFSAAYGPYRRFTGGDVEISKIFINRPKLGAHLSAFGENVALMEATNWLTSLYSPIEEEIDDIKNQMKLINEQFSGTRKLLEIYKNNLQEKEIPSLQNRNLLEQIGVRMKQDEAYLTLIQILKSRTEKLEEQLGDDDKNIINCLIELINSSDFLPNNTQLESVTPEGVFFKDGNGNLITVNQLSDGYRSILSLTFELIRQLIRVYGEAAVFENIRKDDMRITLPGVVLIDEIDAHLHPTWQTKIGQWFLKYFPNLQFIVTTHSPLVCRAAEKGTIWKLAAPGSDQKSEQVTGIDRDRLVYGNILDAYGTEEFGDVSISKEASNKIDRLAELNHKSIMGDTDDSEEKELQQLKSIYPTEKVK